MQNGKTGISHDVFCVVYTRYYDLKIDHHTIFQDQLWGSLSGCHHVCSWLSFHMVELGVNIDHVATIREARQGLEPDPVWAAVEAELGGADGITFHLREDRRHMQDHDVERLKTIVQTQLNFELAPTAEVVAIACHIKPQMAMLVPEKREEVTTEGGLDVVGHTQLIKPFLDDFRSHNIAVSAFIDADQDQIHAAANLGFSVCEIHTGPYANAFQNRRDPLHPDVQRELKLIAKAGELVQTLGMQFNAGHGLNYRNVQPIARLEGLNELHIGHSIVSRAVFVGMRDAVREMKRLMTEATTNTP